MRNYIDSPIAMRDQDNVIPSIIVSNRIIGIDFSRYVVRIDVYNVLPRQQHLGDCACAATIRACENIQILAHGE